MWYFDSPHIVYGEDARCVLETVEGRRAFIVTDPTMVRLGFVDEVRRRLESAGLEVAVFSEVEPEPSLQTAVRGAEAMRAFEPDWIVGLGGGSCLDAAKAMWIMYERPDVTPDSINPFDTYHLRQKARLITIPTTSGTGSEVTWAIVLTDTAEQRKLGLGTRECVADIAIVDPYFVQGMPARLTADTGMDALTHAFEAYVNTWHNDFSDGLALQAIKLIFTYLPRAYRDGKDMEAREHMHNAATIAGLACSNSLFALAHSLGHSLGALFHIPHGRAVGLFLPYTIEYSAPSGAARYADIARFLGLPADDEETAAWALSARVRQLMHEIDQPQSIAALGIARADFDAQLEALVDRAESDSQTVTSPRVPDRGEFARLFVYAYEGRPIDF
jgi:alcohol dehydrogenase class IV